jgi:phospholipid-binding lipoprotein MlaA
MKLSDLVFSRLRHGVGLVALLALLGGCVNPAEQPTDAAAADPIEPFNRYVFEVNRFVDEIIGKPVAHFYRAAVPMPARRSISNALGNLQLPMTAANDVLQGDPGRAGDAVGRFALNSTFGFFGLFDMASDVGFRHHSEDFGQTLGSWGVSGDPYIVLPILGPSSPRDAVGWVVDGMTDPVTIAAQGGMGRNRGNGFTTARTAIGFVSGRERVLEAVAELERGQDFYAAMRSAHRQRRAGEIRNDQPNETTIPRRFRFGDSD